jgi:hypothetical protein
MGLASGARQTVKRCGKLSYEKSSQSRPPMYFVHPSETNGTWLQQNVNPGVLSSLRSPSGLSSSELLLFAHHSQRTIFRWVRRPGGRQGQKNTGAAPWVRVPERATWRRQRADTRLGHSRLEQPALWRRRSRQLAVGCHHGRRIVYDSALATERKEGYNLVDRTAIGKWECTNQGCQTARMCNGINKTLFQSS